MFNRRKNAEGRIKSVSCTIPYEYNILACTRTGDKIRIMSRDRFPDVAFSFAAEDSWLATDISTVLRYYNLDVYSFQNTPDAAGGFLRTRLREIYSASRLNILIWSDAYMKKTEATESIVAMEYRGLIHRHIEKGDGQSLFVARVDRTSIPCAFEPILVHQLQDHGITGLEKLVINRIRDLSVAKNHDGMVRHPKNTETVRSGLTPCKFKIHANYFRDSNARWEKLADILTDYKRPNCMPQVYLIPSGACAELLRHSSRLGTIPELLELKREAGKMFARNYLNQEINGFWFTIRKDEIDVIAVYAPVYDRFLNEFFGKSHSDDAEKKEQHQN
jgi:hypothetical protein